MRASCLLSRRSQGAGTKRRGVLALYKLLAIVALSACMSACGRAVLAPIGKDPRVSDISQPVATERTSHIVSSGETLYSIAFKYGLNFREIAKWNNIPTPYVIYPGQRLGLLPDSAAGGEPSLTSDIDIQVGGVNEIASTDADSTVAAVAQPETDVSTTNNQTATWVWPVKGRVITSFKRSGRKGIDISGELGQLVRAAADGKVVYSGGGLIGYGELIIIKHNNNFLSAYGHNNKLLVKQGDFVESGQRIATMGRSGTDEVKLHFEIRRDGKPVDPIRYLPK